MKLKEWLDIQGVKMQNPTSTETELMEIIKGLEAHNEYLEARVRALDTKLEHTRVMLEYATDRR